MTNEEWLKEACDLYPGWASLIKSVNDKCEEFMPNYQILQIKEKFGGLRYYYRASKEDYPMKDLGMEICQLIVKYAEIKSLSTCMYCGEPAKLRQHVGWHCALCNDCFKKEFPNEPSDTQLHQ